MPCMRIFIGQLVNCLLLMFTETSNSELTKFGHLLELHVCDNVGDHLIGNVYARFEWETEAQTAVDALNTRWYAGSWTLL
jgi:splicing factor U2AF 35 kDa subunit